MTFTPKISPFKVYEMDLSSGRTNEPLGLVGAANTLTITAAPSAFSFKVNGTDGDSIDGIKGLKQDGIAITEIYITNAIGSGTAKIYLAWVN